MTPALPWRQSIQEYIRMEARPPEKFGHQPRLYALTREIGRGLDYDDDVVFAAAWLHDLGVFEGHRPQDLKALAAWDNVAYAGRQAPAILMRFGFPEPKIPLVVEVIHQHQPSAEPSSTEAVILRDADILEQLGAIGALRTICKVGRDTRFPGFGEAVGSLRKAVDILPGKIRLEQTRTLAEPRLEILRSFLDAAEREATPL